jgi:quinol-cytochrome oxidoreductase complex cytochrome b subunit
MRFGALREALAAPARRRRLLFLELGRLGVFLFGVLVVSGVLLALYYRPSAEAAFDSLVRMTNSAKFGWFVRGLHRIAGHAIVVVTGVYVIRGFFRRLFLKQRGARAWPLAVGLAFVFLAFLLTGESLPWNQHAYWQTVVNANLLSELPIVGGWLADAFRGGSQVTSLTVVRVYAIHVLILPWIATGLLLLARDLRKRGDLE